MKFKKVTHVIFDMDGLLIDSETVYDKIIYEIAQEYDKEYPDSVRLKILGRTEQDTAKTVVDDLNLPLTYEEFLSVYRQRSQEEFTNVGLMPGAKQLVRHLYDQNIPIAVATSSSQDEMELKAQFLQDVFGLFHHIVCGSTDPAVKRGKPAPDIFLTCAARFPNPPHPSQCLVFEDSPNGVRGALDAGMQAILVPADWVGQELRASATMVLKTLEDFQPELFSLPPMKTAI